jgi:hypothetical protein
MKSINTGNRAILKGRIAATPRYSALRVSTMSDSQIQKTVTSRCSAVRTHATPDGHRPTPDWDTGHTQTIGLPDVSPLVPDILPLAI